MGPFRVLDLAAQGKSTALDFLFFPISAPLDIAGNFFDTLNDGVVGTSSRILTAPLNAVFGPVNRYVDGVTGRFEATVDGAAYAFTEVKGALIAGAFASASQGAANNGLELHQPRVRPHLPGPGRLDRQPSGRSERQVRLLILGRQPAPERSSPLRRPPSGVAFFMAPQLAPGTHQRRREHTGGRD